MISLRGCTTPTKDWERLNDVTSRLASGDATLWGHEASAEAGIRLGWLELPHQSRELLPILDALVAWSREIGHNHLILCGMGGSSLAPEVMAKSFDKKLTILDSTDPDQVSSAMDCDLARTCIIIGSKSGSTIETASQRVLFTSLLKKSNLDPRHHMVVVTDPGSPLDQAARSEGLRTINANPNVGGRFSALSAFGLVPAALLGIDVSVLLDDAAEAMKEFTIPDSSAVRMAAQLADPRFAFCGFYDADSEVPGLGDWIEQLIAESTGKNGRGVLPIVTNNSESDMYPVIGFTNKHELAVVGPLGAQFIFWEWVTALLGYLLSVDPFNQPNVTESKERTGALLSDWEASPLTHEKAIFETSSIAIFSSAKFSDLSGYLKSSIESSRGYLAIMAYLNREKDSEVVALREVLEKIAKRPTTFGWGPRFLHSTGQFHKGGPLTGSFIQITSESSTDVEIPGAGYGFQRLILAQALGDNQALVARELPVLRLHLKDREMGIKEILAAASSL